MNDESVENNLHIMSRVPYLIQAWVNTGAGIPGVGGSGIIDHDTADSLLKNQSSGIKMFQWVNQCKNFPCENGLRESCSVLSQWN